MYRNPKPTIDVVVYHNDKVLLVKRGREPFKGRWVFPGGFVDYGETVEEASVREVKEETGIDVRLVEILGVYSAPDRDPREHHVNVVFIGEYISGDAKGGDDAEEAKWREIESIAPDELAFDHGLVLMDFKRWLREGGTYWSTRER